jgi:hypothetical protein
MTYSQPVLRFPLFLAAGDLSSDGRARSVSLFLFPSHCCDEIQKRSTVFCERYFLTADVCQQWPGQTSGLACLDFQPFLKHLNLDFRPLGDHGETAIMVDVESRLGGV